MWETIVGGLILAAITGTVFLAYNHPKQFKALSPYLLIALLVVWLIPVVWWVALAWVRMAALPVLGYSMYMKLEPLLTDAMPSATMLTVVPPVIVVSFAVLNLWVVKLKGDGKPS